MSWEDDNFAVGGVPMGRGGQWSDEEDDGDVKDAWDASSDSDSDDDKAKSSKSEEPKISARQAKILANKQKKEEEQKKKEELERRIMNAAANEDPLDPYSQPGLKGEAASRHADNVLADEMFGMGFSDDKLAAKTADSKPVAIAVNSAGLKTKKDYETFGSALGAQMLPVIHNMHAAAAIESFLRDTLCKLETSQVRQLYDVCSVVLKSKQNDDKLARDKLKKGKSKGKDIKVEREGGHRLYDDMADFM